MMSPDAIADALEDRFRLLTGGGRNAQARQQTLEASVAWSHDLLDEAERALLRRLSVFKGVSPWRQPRQCAPMASSTAYAVLDLLSRLVDKSLTSWPTTWGQSPATACWRRSVTTLGTACSIRARPTRSVIAISSGSWRTPSGPSPNWVRPPDRRGWTASMSEHDNLQSALEWAEITGHHETVLRLATALSLFWEARGHRHQGIGGRWFARALAVDHGPSVARARALWAAAHMGIYGGDIARHPHVDSSGARRGADGRRSADHRPRRDHDQLLPVPLLARGRVGGLDGEHRVGPVHRGPVGRRRWAQDDDDRLGGTGATTTAGSRSPRSWPR